MFIAAVYLGPCCCPKAKKLENHKLNGGARLLVAGLIGDALLITAFVLGVLAVTGKLSGLPPAAAYTGIALGGFSIATWIWMFGASKCGVVPQTARLLRAAVSCKPKS